MLKHLTKRIANVTLAVILSFVNVASGVAADPYFRWGFGDWVRQGGEQPVEHPAPEGDIYIGVSQSVRGRIGVPFALRFAADGGAAPLTWAIDQGKLPETLKLDAVNGVIFGTPTEVADYRLLIVSATDRAGVWGRSRTFDITVKPVPVVNVEPMYSAPRGQSFQITPTAENVFGSQSWSVVGTLPFGMSINENTGVISGTSEQDGTFPNIQIAVVDSDGAQGVSAPTSIVTSTDLKFRNLEDDYTLRVGAQFTGPQPTVEGAQGVVTYAIAGGNLPNGITINSSTGVLRGVPSEIGVTDAVYIRGTDKGTGRTTVFGPISFNVIDNPELVYDDVFLRAGTAVTMKPKAKNLIGMPRYSLVNALPGGLTMEPATGVISGVATLASTSLSMISVTDISDGRIAESNEFSIVVAPRLDIRLGAVPKLTVGEPVTIPAPEVVNLRGRAIYAVRGTLPKGLSIDADTGIISGTPEVSGYRPVTYYVIDSLDNDSATSDWLNLNVFPAPVPTVFSLGDYPATIKAQVGMRFSTPAPVVRNANGSVEFAISGYLPEWAEFNGATGVVSGLPLAPETVSGLAVVGVDGSGSQARTHEFSIVASKPYVAPLTIENLPEELTGYVGVGLSGWTPLVTGATGKVTFALEGSSIPDWLLANPETGRVGGTPTAVGEWTGIVLTAIDEVGAHGRTAPFDVVVTKLPVDLAITGVASRYTAVLGSDWTAPAPVVVKGQPPYELSIVGDLPSWASFNDQTWVISGKPNAIGEFPDLMFQVKDGKGDTVRSRPFAISVRQKATPTIDIEYQGDFGAFVGKPFSSGTPLVSENSGSLEFTATDLPAWLSMNPATGELSGVPDLVGTTAFRVGVVDKQTGGRGYTAMLSVIVTGLPGLAISNVPQFFQGVVGARFQSATPTVVGQDGDVTFHLTGSPAPDWLLFNSRTGQMTGIPTSSGAFGPFSIAVVDSVNRTAISGNFTIQIEPFRSTISISPIGPTFQAVKGQYFSSGTPVVNGAKGPLKFSISDGDLSTWALLDDETGEISGTPSVASSIGLRLQVKDLSTGNTATSNVFDIMVGDDLLRLSPVAASYSGRVFSAFATGQVGVENARGAVNFALASGALPDWATLNSATGKISGTPTESGTSYGLSIRATESGSGRTGVTEPFDIDIASVDPMSAKIAPSTTVPFEGEIRITPNVVNRVGVVSWTLNSGDLPEWLTLDKASGVISGVGSVVGVIEGLSLKATSSFGVSATTSPFKVAVLPPPSLSIDHVPETNVLHVGEAFSTSKPVTNNAVGAVTWSISSEGTALPAWATLNVTTGVVSGTPTQSGTISEIVLQAVDENQVKATTNAFSLMVEPERLAVSEIAQPAKIRIDQAINVATPAATGAESALIWSVASGVLPTWASIDDTTGRITGTALSTGTWPGIILKATESASGRTALSNALTIVVFPAAPQVTVKAETQLRTQRSANVSPKASYIIGDQTWTLSGALPTGLSMNTSTGTISGTPTAVGTWRDITVEVQDSADGTTAASNPFTIIVESGTPLPEIPDLTGRIDKGFEFTPSLSHADAPYTWAIEAGALPPGLGFDTQTGQVSGVPTVVGEYSGIRLSVTDARKLKGVSSDFKFAVAPQLKLVATETSFHVRAGDGLLAQAPQVTGLVGTPVFSVLGTLPAGLVVDNATGVISGTPNAPGTYAVSLKVRDQWDGNEAVSASLTFEVIGPMAIAIDTKYTGRAKTPMQIAPVLKNGEGDPRWAIAEGDLPSWASFDKITGVIAGTPPLEGLFGPIKLKAQSGALTVTSAAFTIQVTPKIVVTSRLIYGARVSREFAGLQPVADGAIGSVRWDLEGAAPTWLGIDQATGVFSGVPSSNGKNVVRLRATDEFGDTAVSGDIAIDVADRPSIAYATVSTRVNSEKSILPTVSGLVGGGKYVLEEGQLPPWADINPNTGAVVGRPDAVGTFPGIRVKVTDADGMTAISDPFSIVVTAGIQIQTEPEDKSGRLTFGFASSVPTVKNALGPVHWVVISGGVPSGLSLNSRTGQLTGVPTSLGTYKFVLRAIDEQDGSWAETRQVSIDIKNLLGISGAASYYAWHVDMPFAKFAPQAVNAIGPVTWSLVEGSLPVWATLDTSTGAVTGTPQQTGKSTFRLEARTEDGSFAKTGLTSIEVLGPLEVANTATLYSARFGFAFRQSPPTAINLIGAPTWSIEDALPAWVNFDTATAVMSGLPDAITASNGLRFVLKDETGAVAKSFPFDLEVFSRPTTTMPSGPYRLRVGNPFSVTPTGLGVVGTKIWSVSGAMPNGLSVDHRTGVISGTPTDPGSHSLTLRLTDSADNQVAEIPFVIEISEALVFEPMQTSYRLRAGQFLTTDPAIVLGARGTITLGQTGTIPPGTAFVATTGVVNGLTTAAAKTTTYQIDVIAKDSFDDAEVIKRLTIETGGTLGIDYPEGSASYLRWGGQVSSPAPEAINVLGDVSWDVVNGTLPNGISVDPESGALTGVATGSGSLGATYRIRMRDSFDGATATNSTPVLTINDPLTITGATLVNAATDTPVNATMVAATAVGDIRWSAIGLPAGLSLSGGGANAATGRLAGTPAAAGVYPVVITAKDGTDAAVAEHALSVVVGNSPKISRSDIIGTRGVILSAPVKVNFSGQGYLRFRLVYENANGQIDSDGVSHLPAGLVFDELTGEIYGSPSVAVNLGPRFGIKALAYEVFNGTAVQTEGTIAWFRIGVQDRDTIPDPFTIPEAVPATEPGIDVISNSVTVKGFSGPVTITATAPGLVSVAGGPWSASATITAGESFRVKLVSPPIDAPVTTAITVGDGSPATWRVETTDEIVVTIDTIETNVDVQAKFGVHWAGTRSKRLIQAEGVAVYSTSSSIPAMLVPGGYGGKLTLDLRGPIYGGPGAANGGNGGNGLQLEATGVTVKATQPIYGGGGGGGKGGQGGAGSYQATVREPATGENYKQGGYMGWTVCPTAGDKVTVDFGTLTGYNQNRKASSSNTALTQITASDGYTYYRGSQKAANTECTWYGVYRTSLQTATSSGGAGGTGGSGGGYGKLPATGSTGSSGTNGSGKGGDGGNGGSAGKAGTAGGRGVAGNAGTGADGSPGGLAGYAIFGSPAAGSQIAQTIGR